MSKMGNPPVEPDDRFFDIDVVLNAKRNYLKFDLDNETDEERIA